MFLIILTTCFCSCSWIDQTLSETNGHYYKTFNCSSQVALNSAKEILSEENYSGIIVNHEDNHRELWFKLNEQQRVRLTFSDLYFWRTNVSFYCTENSSKIIADKFFTKLEIKNF